MWMLLATTLALAHVCSGLVVRGFSVPSAAEYGSTVYMELDYRLDRGEYIHSLEWSKDNTVFYTYSERPEHSRLFPIDGITIDAESTQRRVILVDVGDAASGQYTVQLQVSGPSGHAGNIVNSQHMQVGDTLAGRFGGSGPANGNSGSSFFQSSFSSSDDSGNIGTDGVASFQAASVHSGDVSGVLDTRGAFQGVSAGEGVDAAGVDAHIPTIPVLGPTGGISASFAGDLASSILDSVLDTRGGVFSETTGVGGSGQTSFQSASVGGGVGSDGVVTSFQSVSSGGGSGVAPGGGLDTRGVFQSSAAGVGLGAGIVPADVGPGLVHSVVQTGTPGAQASFQFTSGAGDLDTRGSFSGGSADTLHSALSQAQANLQNAVNQINQINEAINNAVF